MAIPIDQDLHQEVKDYIRDKYGSKKGDILFSERIMANQSLHTGKYLFERL